MTRKHTEDSYLVGVSDRVRSLYEWIDALLAAVLILVLAFSFVLRVVSVSGTSMQPALLPGDKVLLTGLPTDSYRRGEVVVVAHATENDEPIIKRVIATQGQTVNIDSASGKVLVDGAALDERLYLPSAVKTTLQSSNMQFPLKVPAGKLFVLGDNRAVSLDSRSSEVGLISTKNILGQARLVLFPFSRFGKVKGTP